MVKCLTARDAVNRHLTRMKKLLIILWLLVTSLSDLSGQLVFSGYSIADGLSQSVVNCILQDSKGFMWFGTQNGLNRFNGNSFEVFTYRPADTTSLSNNWIYAIAEDREGNLWIGTKGGLNRYIRSENRFERIRYTTSYSPDVTEYVYDVKCSRNGRILINTPPVLTICDPVTLSFTHYTSPLPYDGSVKDAGIPLLEAANGKIWMGSASGLTCFDPGSGIFEMEAKDPLSREIINGGNISALYQDSRGELYVGTASGLFRWRSTTFEAVAVEAVSGMHQNTRSPLQLLIRAITEDAAGNLWAGTEGGGLLRISRDTNGMMAAEIFTAANSGVRHDIVLSLATDRTENLWAGTLSGISKADLKRQKFRLYRKSDSPNSVDMTGNVIASLYKDKYQRIWVGTWGQGLNIYDRKTGTTEHYASRLPCRNHIPNDFVHTIFEDTNGLIFLGTRDGLLIFLWEKHTFIRPVRHPQNPGLPNLNGLRIFTMMQSHAGDYWIATQDGLYRKPAAGGEMQRFHPEAPPGRRISSNLVYHVLEDREGSVWIATSEGLDVLHPGSGIIRHFRKTEGKANPLSDNFITALCEDHAGDIWIGTASYVNRFSRKDSSFTYYEKEQGLTGNLVYGIRQDTHNDLWFATGNGLCRYDRETDSFHAYGVADGLQSQEFNLGASFVAADGEMFFGGMNGFNSFFPDSLSGNPHVPPIVITAAYKQKEGAREYFDLGKSHRIELRHNDKSFTIEFAALEFTNPQENRYRYRLEGIDQEWIDLETRNFVPFSKLPAGEYVFRVQGSNNDGLWNEEGSHLEILIRSPWWGSRLAFITYALFTALLIFLVFRSRERQHARDRQMLEEKVTERTLRIEEQKAEIMQKNAQLNQLNASKDKFFSIIAHDLRNPFNSIIGLTDLMLMDMEELPAGKLQKSLENIRDSSTQAHELLENLLLWARSATGTMPFRPGPVDMQKLVEESIALLKAQATARNITIHNDCRENLILPADENMMKTILRNLLTNAVKYTQPEGEVWISMSSGNGKYVISVKDNGPGIPHDKMDNLFEIGASHKTRERGQMTGSGLGLILCREMASRHGGRIEVSSEEGMGSEFRVVIPVTSYPPEQA